MKKQTLTLLGALMLSVCSTPFAANKALLIGINEYKGTKYDLKGTINDVEALNTLLQDQWGFKRDNINTLLDYDASKKNILEALTKLTENAQPGDQIFIYFSGHGTSVHDRKLGLPLPYSSGALVPQDFSNTGTEAQMMKQLIIGKTDLKPILSILDKTQAETFVVFDSCYSGNTVRGLYAQSNGLRSRQMPVNLPTRAGFNDYNDEEITDYNTGRHEIEAYPYDNIFFLSAANEREVAKDISGEFLKNFPTLDGKSHGAFTDALLQALSGKLDTDRNHDGRLSYDELYTAIREFMQQRGYGHAPQVLPQLKEDKNMLHMRSVLGKQRRTNPVQTRQPGLLSIYTNSQNPGLLSRLKQLQSIQISDQPVAEVNLSHQKDGNYRLINQSGDLIGQLVAPSIQQVIGRIQQEVWKKRFKQQLQQHASINIDFSLKDSLKGSNAVEGELIAFTLRSEKTVHLLLLDVDSRGRLAVLYPQRRHELNAIPAHQLTYIPGENPNDLIKVKAPFGTDHLIAIGFSQPPDFLKEFVKKETLDLQTDLYKKLENYLQTASYGYSELDLLTVPARSIK